MGFDNILNDNRYFKYQIKNGIKTWRNTIAFQFDIKLITFF